MNSTSPVNNLRGFLSLSGFPKVVGLDSPYSLWGVSKLIATDSQKVLIVANNCAVLFDIGQVSIQWRINCPCVSGTLNSDGSLLALGGYETIYIWDLAQATVKKRIAVKGGWVSNLLFHPNNRLLALTIQSPEPATEHTVGICNMEQAEDIRTLQRSSLHDIRPLTFSPQGEYLAISNYNSVSVWNPNTGEITHRFDEYTPGVTFPSVTFSSDKNILAIGIAQSNGEKCIDLWSLAGYNKQKIGRFDCSPLGDNWSLAFSRDNRILASAGWNPPIRLWNVATGKQQVSLETRVSSGLSSSDIICFSSDNRLLLRSSNGVLQVFDTQSGQEIGSYEPFAQRIKSIAFLPDNQIVAVADGSSSVRMLNATTGREHDRAQFHSKPVNTLAYSRSGQQLASGSDDGTICIYDVIRKQQITRITVNGQITALAYSSDGGRLVFAGSSLLGISGVSNSPKPFMIDVMACRFSNPIFTKDDQYVVVAHDGLSRAIALRNSGNLSEVAEVGLTGFEVQGLTLSPDGRYIAVALDKSIELWEIVPGRFLQAPSLRRVRAMHGHKEKVTAVAFHPTGQIIASGSFDETLRLWDVYTGNQTRTVETGTTIDSVAFSPEGTFIGVGGRGDVFFTWRVG